jgi:hypothetical protein
MTDREAYAVALLKEGKTCVIVGKERMLCSTRRGVAPLLSWLDDKEDCQGAFAADKVVGRAAAFLYVLLGVAKVHALVLSESAEEVLLRFGVPYSFEERVAAIRNRTGDGFCPMEQAVLEMEEPMEALGAIRMRLAQLQEETK